MNSFAQEIHALTITDGDIRWEVYRKQEPVCSQFSIDTWRLIASDIDSDQQWDEFIESYIDVVACFFLYHANVNKPLGFVYILFEDPEKRVVSLHGGGWEQSVRASITYYTGFIRLIRTLIIHHIKVRTQCLITNKRAYRFLHSIGFVKYRQDEQWFYFYISEKRLQNRISSRYDKIKP